MICKNCLCLNLCLQCAYKHDELDEFFDKNYTGDCPHYKDKAQFLEFPCKIGDVVVSSKEEMEKLVRTLINSQK